MSNGHHHPHDHSHGHPSHDHSPGGQHGDPGAEGTPEHLDTAIPDAELAPLSLARRNFLRAAGLLGAGLAGASVVPAPRAAADSDSADAFDGRGPATPPGQGLTWIAGDHHIHTQYSPDGRYRVMDQVQHAAAYGLGWMVITDHGTAAHAKIGVEKVNPDIRAARSTFGKDTLVFQGLEWNIPAAEHGTVFVHPGGNEVAVLKEFENSFDGTVRGWGASSAVNEQHALEGLDFLATAITARRVDDAMFFANHPARKGIDSPHEIRGWRDRQPTIALGMEGAPGHQAAGIPKPEGPGSGRGYYDNSPSANSFPGYPIESYVTYGGFDWMTATVGGLWDSLLAEGKPWWITANSDSHSVFLDTAVRGGGDFDADGRYGDPVHGGVPARDNGDFWPGYYSRTHVGADRFSYAAVMSGLRSGRVWVDHGRLVDAVDVRVVEKNRRNGYPLGSVVTTRRGRDLELAIQITTASLPNWAQFVPKLAKVDVIVGDVTGPVADADSFQTPNTSVVQTFDVSGRSGTFELRYPLGNLEKGFYARVRGSDGKRLQPGLPGASIDPAGPAVDALGNADPWQDLWFYTNPIWVLPR